MSNILSIKNLHAKVDSKEILQGVSLEIQKGEIHALMGPNGSGKSTLAQVLMGNPEYEVTSGSIDFIQNSFLDLSPDKRAKAGLFLAFQYPSTIHGVTLGSMLRTAYNSVKGEKLTPIKFKKLIQEKLDLLGMDEKYLDRSINDGFSGGEKKKAEILQMLVLEPKLAILDETDSGLDVDALKIVAEGIKVAMKQSPEMSVLIITHYQRILDHIQPDHVHVMKEGKIIKSGDHKLAKELEKDGYEKIDKNR